MSGLDGLELDADGFVDMDQFPDDGSDLVGADLEQLRAALHADPVDEPTPEQWDAIVDDVVGLDLDAGPFAVDDPDALLPDPAEDGTDDAAPDDLDDVDPDGDEPGEADAGADDADGVAEVDDDVDLDGLDDVDVDLDLDGGLDLMTADDAGDDPFDAAADGADDAAADVGPDFEDLL